MRGRRLVGLGLWVAVGALGAATAALAAPRFATVVPEAGGKWRIELGGDAPRDVRALQVAIDGVVVPASFAPHGGGLAATLSGVGPDARRLELRDKGRAVAAVELRAPRRNESPFAEWIVYQIMVEMFRDGSVGNDSELHGWRHPRYAGGDLQGVLEEVDYLRQLGVNAVWLSPIFPAQTSHGYDVQNYYRVGPAVAVPGDPAASEALFGRLRDALHQNGIRLILDLPLNHASKQYQRREGDPKGFGPRATGPQQEAEKLWDSWGAGYQYWNFDHPPTRRFLTDVALHWLVDEKVDGLRLDYARGVPHDFWAELDAAVKQAKPEAFLVGEAWQDQSGVDANAQDIATYFAPLAGKPQFDSLFDFPLQMTMTGVFAKGNEPARRLEDTLQETAALYGPGAVPTRFLDNHDLARFMDWTNEPDRLVAALAFMGSLGGPEVLFYGTEVGLAGGQAKDGFTDSGRIPMPWEAPDRKLFGRVQEVLRLRSEHPALARGGRLPLWSDDSTLVMAKLGTTELLLVALNLGPTERDLDLEPGALVPAGATLSPVWGGGAAKVEGGKLRWHLPPRTLTIVSVAPPAPPAGH